MKQKSSQKIQFAIKIESTMYKSIEDCLKNRFGCNDNKIKKGNESVIANLTLDKENNKDKRFKNAKYRSQLNADIVGYSSEEKSLYVVECKSVTDLTTKGVNTAVGQIMVDKIVLLLFGVADVKRNLGLESNEEIKNLYFYIALPDLPDSPDGSKTKGSINERIPPATMKVLEELFIEQGIGLLKITNCNAPAIVHFYARPIPIYLRDLLITVFPCRKTL